jgi:hypothetical protein
VESPWKSLALILSVDILLSQAQTVARREGTPDQICELHYENAPDGSTLDYLHASQTVPSITGAIVAGGSPVGCGAGNENPARGSRPLLPVHRIAAAVETGNDGERFVSLNDEHERVRKATGRARRMFT